jgi:DNA-binding GntR family transcriptional regulator
MDDLQLELVALSQSARLTRDQMRLQAEFSPLLRLIDVNAGTRSRHRELFGSVLDAVGAGDEDAAGDAIERLVGDAIDALDALRLQADDF